MIDGGPWRLARSSDPDTSHEAAASLDDQRLSECRRKILELLRSGPATDEEIARAECWEEFPQSPSSLRTRRAELVDVGLVLDSGATRPTLSGRKATVWRAAVQTPGEYGPCGHHSVNIGSGGCSICLAETPHRRDARPDNSTPEIVVWYTKSGAIVVDIQGGSNPMETEVKTERPLSREEAKGLMVRYIDEANRGIEEARPLRERIAKGAQILTLPDLSPQERADATERMNVLTESLRAAEWASTLGLGLAMAYAVAESVAEAEQKDGLHPPAGSILTVKMPGVMDVSIKLDKSDV